MSLEPMTVARAREAGTTVVPRRSSTRRTCRPPLLPLPPCTFKSSRVERLVGTAVIAASLDPAVLVASNNFNIDLTTGISARLYLTNLFDTLPKKLVYFHGGSVIIAPLPHLPRPPSPPKPPCSSSPLTTTAHLSPHSQQPSMTDRRPSIGLSSIPQEAASPVFPSTETSDGWLWCNLYFLRCDSMNLRIETSNRQRRLGNSLS